MASDATDETEPRRRGSGSALVYDRLKREILETTLQPGDLLDETSLSLRFRLSRTPVREALVRLVAEGLATTLPNRSTVVAGMDAAELPQFFDAMMLLYRLTTRLAAERHSAADLAGIRHVQAEFVSAMRSADAIRMLELNRDFHLAIAEASHNRYYADFCGRVLNEGMRLLRTYYLAFSDRLPPRYAEEHDAMIAAIAARDADTAERLGAAHAAQIVENVQRMLDPGLGATLALGMPATAKAIRSPG